MIVGKKLIRNIDGIWGTCRVLEAGLQLVDRGPVPFPQKSPNTKFKQLL
jgi:hypothetical protein